jgi:outer membrane protein OmpA-like peptidoglycan-associated protein
MNALCRLLIAAPAALAAGCAITPEANDSVARAREAYQRAQADAQVKRFAPTELMAARRALGRAEQLARESAGPEWIEHEAYLAAQRTRIAEQTAMVRSAEVTLAQASSERERVLLEARARQAELARSRAEQQAQSAEAARIAAEQARAQEAASAEAQAGAQLNAELQRLQAQVAELQTQQTERGTMLRFAGDVLFDVGQANLKPGARRTLERLADVLRKQPGRNLVVEGYTDNSGSPGVNQRLSEDRAEAVRQALVQYGVPRENISVRGMGDAYPVANNQTATGRQLNRRVEILIPGASDTSAIGAGATPGASR